jgi:hypothetical protein
MGLEEKASAVIAGQSGVFDRLMSECMIEAQIRSVNLPDVQLEDFILFCQFACCGDYTPPEFTINEPNTTESALEDSHVGESRSGSNETRTPGEPREMSGPDQISDRSIESFSSGLPTENTHMRSSRTVTDAASCRTCVH